MAERANDGFFLGLHFYGIRDIGALGKATWEGME
jgi:hypothetical protein